MRNGFNKAWSALNLVLLLQLTGCASSSAQVQAHPSETGSFVVSQPLSIVVLNFVNEANSNGGDNDIITKLVAGQFADVQDETKPIYSVDYYVHFKSLGGSTEVTYYLAGGIGKLRAGNFRAVMIDYANDRPPPFW